MNHKSLPFILLIIVSAISCSKQQEWLDVKTNKADVVLSKLSDYQALLDLDDIYMNSSYPFLPQVSCDDYFVTDAVWAAGGVAAQRNAYIWNADIYAGGSGSDWYFCYVMVAYANICLEGLTKIERDASNATAWENVQGSAYFYRGLAYYMLTQEFSAPYDAAIANTSPGIVLRNSADVNKPAVRASMAASWQQVLNDLQQAETLLPDFPAFATRPSRWAVRGLLARVNLAMADYAAAKSWADKALTQNGYLLDFNTLNAAATYPLPTYQAGNKEIMLYATASSTNYYSGGFVDSLLYRSYANNDLRRTLYFKASGNNQAFRGQYSGVVSPFGGIATNEIYLVRAEANARLGNTSAALADLNALLINRWKTGTFTAITATSANDALQKILTERRKELLFYGSSRWEDLRRLNREPAFAKTLTRVVNGQIYTLPPGDNRYTMPIPDNEINISRIPQNPR